MDIALPEWASSSVITSARTCTMWKIQKKAHNTCLRQGFPDGIFFS